MTINLLALSFSMIFVLRTISLATNKPSSISFGKLFGKRFNKGRSLTTMHVATNSRELSALLSPQQLHHDYANASKRAADLFRDKSDVPNDVAVETVVLVSKKEFKEWCSKISNTTLSYLAQLGNPMEKFPGSKTYFLPGINPEHDLSVVSIVSFYDDSSKADYKAFDGLWSGLRPNKTYSFVTVNQTELECDLANKLTTSFALSKYTFSNFKSSGKLLSMNTNNSATVTPNTTPASTATMLVWPEYCDKQAVLSCVRAHTLMKDLTETPGTLSR